MVIAISTIANSIYNITITDSEGSTNTNTFIFRRNCQKALTSSTVVTLQSIRQLILRSY
jgi:hypothetical protein